MEKLEIHSALKAYERLKPKRFHMPGHKANKDFCKIFGQAKQDITELAFSDSLASPTGIIKTAETNVANILGAKKSYFITDGSTCGIFTMLYAVRERGSKIIINRNAHQSIFNACKIFNIEPIILKQNIKHGVMLPPSIDEIELNIKNNPDCIGLLLTYPDYYGLVFDLKKAKELTLKYDKLLLIDGAHGGHLKFDVMPSYAGEYADIWVDGVHKTLPCLTQSALLNVGNKLLINKVNNAITLFRTTSPSYLIMSSIEYGEYYMQEYGKELIGKIRIEVLLMKNRLKALGIKTLDNSDILKFAVDFKSLDISPFLAEKYLNKKHVYVEMNDGRYLLFMFGVTTSKRDLEFLERLIIKISKNKELKGTYEDRKAFSMGVREMPYLQAINNSKKASINIELCEGKISADNIGVFPPCIPLCMAGEIITKDIIDVLLKAKSTFGVSNNKIKVIK